MWFEIFVIAVLFRAKKQINRRASSVMENESLFHMLGIVHRLTVILMSHLYSINIFINISLVSYPVMNNTSLKGNMN